MLKQLLSAVAATEFVAKAIDTDPLIIEGDMNSKVGTGPSSLTQAGCDINNKWYVEKLPSFKSDDTWPCSYAGTLAGDADGAH